MDFTYYLKKAQKFCTYQERCQKELREKLKTWGANQALAEEVICELISQDFINEERFARQYAGGKFRIKHWGKNKIIAALKQKGISDKCIQTAIKDIETEDYAKNINKLIVKYLKLHTPAEKFKLVRYLQSKGYEYDVVKPFVDRYF